MSKSAPSQNPGPIIDADAVLRWYDRNARVLPWRVGPADRAGGILPDPYRVWLSEIMLQQTTVAAVAKYYARFVSLWPRVTDLAAAPLESVLVEWAGLGYYARARNLHACAIAVADQSPHEFPRSAHELSQLPGIGSYTSAAIAAICYDEPVAVVDGNVERVVARFLALDMPVREAKQVIGAAVQSAVPSRAGDFAQALMDLGATICAPRAVSCLICPLQPGCLGAKANPLLYPIKSEKPERPMRYGHAYVMRDAAGDVYLQTRNATGLLAKMTEVPGSDWGDSRADAVYPARGDWRRCGEIVHVFTHFRLVLDVWTAVVDPAPLSEGWWASPAVLDGEALPSLYRKVLAAALE